MNIADALHDTMVRLDEAAAAGLSPDEAADLAQGLDEVIDHLAALFIPTAMKDEPHRASDPSEKPTVPIVGPITGTSTGPHFP